MLQNYVTLSLRLLRRNPFFTFINVIGLSVGFTVFFILWQYAQSELNSDRFYKDWQQMTRFYWSNKNIDDSGYIKEITSSANHPAFYKILASEYPDFENQTRLCFQQQFRKSFIGDHDAQVFFSNTNDRGEKKSFLEKKLIYADPNVFEFFAIPVLKGNSNHILLPNSIVLNEDLAKKYFGENNPVGQTLLLNDSIPLMVSGVFKNLPLNTHLEFEAVMSMQRIEKNMVEFDLTQSAFFSCYFKFPTGSDRLALTKKINDAKMRHLKEKLAKYKIRAEDVPITLQPIEDVSFHKTTADSFVQKNKFFLRSLSVGAVVVLVMAWINYINLSIVSQRRRTKEMAARLSAGARMPNLVAQFMTEALVLNSIALGVALALIQILNQHVQYLFNFYLPPWSQTSLESLLVILGVILTGILCSGAILLIMAVRKTIQGIFGSGKNIVVKANTASAMMLIQFVGAIVLAVSTFVISAQLNYVIEKSLGSIEDNIVIVDLPFLQSSAFHSDLHAFETEISNVPGVIDLTVSTSTAGDNDWNSVTIQRNSQSQVLSVGTDGGVDEHFIPFYSIQLLAGRNFIKDNPVDQSSIIISRKLMERMGVDKPEDAIGMRILAEQHEWTHDMTEAVVIGVIEDYVRLPLLTGFSGYFVNEGGSALTYGHKLDAQSTPKKISIRIGTNDVEGTLAKIESRFHASFGVNPFNWYFLDDFINNNYQNEKSARNQIVLFASIGIGIACLGLLGMISNRIVEKTKEIGIRKVLGAETSEIAKVLLRTTVRQIIIAAIIGVPLAYVLTQQYLEKFSVRIMLQWWNFALPVFIVIFIMLATIAWELLKAARSNPVNALKCE